MKVVPNINMSLIDPRGLSLLWSCQLSKNVHQKTPPSPTLICVIKRTMPNVLFLFGPISVLNFSSVVLLPRITIRPTQHQNSTCTTKPTACSRCNPTACSRCNPTACSRCNPTARSRCNPTARSRCNPTARSRCNPTACSRCNPTARSRCIPTA